MFGRKGNLAVWGVGAALIAIVVVVVLSGMTWQIGSQSLAGMTSAGLTTYTSTQTVIMSSLLLFGVIGLAVIAMFLFTIFR